MQVKTVTEKRVAILRAAMIVARSNRRPDQREDLRAHDVLLACFDITRQQANAFLYKIMRCEWSIGYIARLGLSEVPHV